VLHTPKILSHTPAGTCAPHLGNIALGKSLGFARAEFVTDWMPLVTAKQHCERTDIIQNWWLWWW